MRAEGEKDYLVCRDGVISAAPAGAIESGQSMGRWIAVPQVRANCDIFESQFFFNFLFSRVF